MNIARFAKMNGMQNKNSFFSSANSMLLTGYDGAIGFGG